MSHVTRILAQIEQGDPTAADQLLPLVYDELRGLAAARLAHEKPGQTLQATALVHEAYVRLVGEDRQQPWRGGGSSSRQPPRQCVGSWSKTHGGRRVTSGAAISSGEIVNFSGSRPPAPPARFWRCTKPWIYWAKRTRRKPSWSNSATSSG